MCLELNLYHSAQNLTNTMSGRVSSNHGQGEKHIE